MKTNIRKYMKEKINNLEHDYCVESNQKIAKLLCTLPEYHESKTIFCFVGTEHEIDTKAIIYNAIYRGKRVAVPKCIGKGVMEAYLISSLEDLETGYCGILEPNSSCTLITSEEIDFAIIPCLSANQEGMRIGYGGGYYDRYLRRTNAIRVVLCREKLMSEVIPMEKHDQIMDIVLTEERVIRKQVFQST